MGHKISIRGVGQFLVYGKVNHYTYRQVPFHVPSMFNLVLKDPYQSEGFGNPNLYDKEPMVSIWLSYESCGAKLKVWVTKVLLLLISY